MSYGFQFDGIGQFIIPLYGRTKYVQTFNLVLDNLTEDTVVYSTGSLSGSIFYSIRILKNGKIQLRTQQNSSIRTITSNNSLLDLNGEITFSITQQFTTSSPATITLDGIETSGNLHNVFSVPYSQFNYFRIRSNKAGLIFKSMSLDAVNGNWSYKYDADSSDRSAGAQPVLTDTVAGIDAQGENLPEDGSLWINLSGDDSTSTGEEVDLIVENIKASVSMLSEPSHVKTQLSTSNIAAITQLSNGAAKIVNNELLLSNNIVSTVAVMSDELSIKQKIIGNSFTANVALLKPEITTTSSQELLSNNITPSVQIEANELLSEYQLLTYNINAIAQLSSNLIQVISGQSLLTSKLNSFVQPNAEKVITGHLLSYIKPDVNTVMNSAYFSLGTQLNSMNITSTIVMQTKRVKVSTIGDFVIDIDSLKLISTTKKYKLKR